jgi:hypothetical protein
MAILDKKAERRQLDTLETRLNKDIVTLTQYEEGAKRVRDDNRVNRRLAGSILLGCIPVEGARQDRA